MRLRIWLFVTLPLATLLVPGSLSAQVDTNPPLPNVLLLVDTSGSMEYMAGASGPAGTSRLPMCTAGNPTGTNEQNRWTSLVSVLTGEMQNFSCYPQTRSLGPFKDEYKLGSVEPYDKNYYLPFNRIISGDCTIGPNTASWPPATTAGVFDFPNNVVKYHRYDDATLPCLSGFSQSDDGLLDAFRGQARFGLMTFDPQPTADTGLSGPAGADYATGVNGMWSYYPAWQSGAQTQVAKGRPEACTTDEVLEVGARNPAAPPWEGRLIPFGDSNASDAQLTAQNEKIQKALLMMRPYGATPIAGMLQDASYFLQTDPSADPLDPTNAQKHFGPKDDPFVTGGCRKNFIILLTDGLPNLDLRPGCGNNPPAPDGTCPYRKASDIAYALANNADPNKAIKTFVIGFAVSTADNGGPVPVDCSAITPAGSPTFDPQNKCATPANENLRACCELGRIAYFGGTGNPRFADDKDKLRQAVNDVLSSIASTSTSRTMPVFSTVAASNSVSGTNAPAVAYTFYSSFFVSRGSLWQGVLERQRSTCVKDVNTQSYEAVLQSIDPSKGDSFSTNVNSGSGTPRQFYSLEPAAAVGVLGTAPLPARTLRTTTSADGLGALGGNQVSGNTSTFIATISPASLGVTTPTGSTCSTTSSQGVISASECRNRVLGYDLGVPVPLPSGVTYTRQGNVFGGVYHSTPTIVTKPSDFLRDESYQAFQLAQKDRAPVLYTATLDGQLHAFKVSAGSTSDTTKVDNQQNNELWSFLPPGVLPRLRSMYPGVQQNLLDGAPIVSDVVLQRTSSDAQGTSVAWRTILTAGFGVSMSGYYALDITNPVPVTGDATKGPLFKWQLATDELGNQVFGPRGTPTITTLFFVPPGQSEAREIAVALLPGGTGAALSTTCARANATPANVDPTWTTRQQVPCYQTNDPSRSLTVVRLDTGEVLRTFRRSVVGLAPNLAARTTLANFDSPVSGVPVAYPAGVGAIANRAYVGDQDGTLWRLDLRAKNPAQWSVNLFFDMYSGFGALDGQPIATQPVLSLTPLGDVVVLASTGDQEQFAATAGLRNLAWSVRDTSSVSANALVSKANWHLGRGGSESIANLPTNASVDWNTGERVTGPLSLFNGIVYFSTFRPASSSAQACSAGQSTLWGVDYLQSTSGTSDAAPKGRLLIDAEANPNNPPPAKVQGNGEIIFGVGITRTPACYDTQTYSDPYLGFNQSSILTNMNPGDFKLIVQTGSGGSSTAGGQTNAKTFALPAPPPTVRIDSWAAVVE